jgi:DNA invertase Pin-like site-specific DNA recombinase
LVGAPIFELGPPVPNQGNTDDEATRDQRQEARGSVCPRQHRPTNQSRTRYVPCATLLKRRGWEVVETYNDTGVSGAEARDQRPGLDALLKDASRGKFDVVLAWAIDRLGRSLIDLLGTIQHLEACKVDLYLDQQSIDTTTPMGKLVFQVTGAFAEFERSMIRQRVRAGLREGRWRKGRC